MTSRCFRLALVQTAMSGDCSINEATAVDLVRAAADAGADIVVLPELYRTLYFCQQKNADAFAMAEPVAGSMAQKTFSSLAKQTGVAIVVPIFEHDEDDVYYNTALVFDRSGAVVHRYRKSHIPDDPSFYEKYYFSPGEGLFEAVDLGFVKVAVLICYDQWFPEAARLCALAGAELIVYPSAIGVLPQEEGERAVRIRDAWKTVQRGHAIANGVFVAAVNRTGFESASGDSGIRFFGSSFVSGPLGEILGEAAQDGAETLIVEIDPLQIADVRQDWPFFRDRRPDIYGRLSDAE